MTQLTPISGNYVVGKGQVFFKESGSIKWEELGDIDGFSISPEIERLERFSNQYSARTLADSRIVQQSFTLTMELFQMTRRNRSMGLLSTITDQTQTGATEPTQEISGIVTGGIYELNGLNVTAITVTDTTGSPVAYTSGTHYQLDAEAGMIRIVSKPASANSHLKVFYSKASIVAGDERLKAGIGSSPNLAGAIRFRGVNDVGRAVLVQLHSVRLSPSGERQYISDEYSSITIEGKIQIDSTQATAYQLGWEQDLNTTT